MKLVFAAGTLTLMMIAGTSSTAAAAQWRGGYSHAGHGHHYRAAHLGARGYGYGVRATALAMAAAMVDMVTRGVAMAGGFGTRRAGSAGGVGGGLSRTALFPNSTT